VYEGFAGIFRSWSAILKPKRVIIQRLRDDGFEHIISACLENSRLKEISISFSSSLPTDENEKSLRIIDAFKHKKFMLYIECIN